MIPTSPKFVVVGIGADGWDGLTAAVQHELRSAAVIYGSTRQLALLPRLAARQCRWRSPMNDHLHELANAPAEPTIHVLASGDPLFHGIGVTLTRLVGADRVRVLPAVSSVSLAAARMGWDLATTPTHSLVTAPPDSLIPLLSNGVNMFVLVRDGDSAAAVARLLCSQGFGCSQLTVLSDLGGAGESRRDVPACEFSGPTPALSVLAVSCIGPTRSLAPGLDDSEYDCDAGQLTKRAVRALTVSALRPAPRQLLWDVGAGSGSVAIEWLRIEPTTTAIAFEADAHRRTLIAANAGRHGVANRLTIKGSVPDNLAKAPGPDAIFLGGALSQAGVLETCWQALLDGGILVANVVTAESETLLIQWYHTIGGTLTRIALNTLEPLGDMNAWRPSFPLTQWIVHKPAGVE